MPPRNVAWWRSGRTRAASPPASWPRTGVCAARGCATSVRTAVTARPASRRTAASVGCSIREFLRIWWCAGARGGLLLSVLVVLDAQVRDLGFAHQPAQRVLELGLLNEEIVFWNQPGSGLRTLEVEGQPLLHAAQPGTVRQVEEQRQIEH